MPHSLFARRLGVAVELLRQNGTELRTLRPEKMTLEKANEKAMKLAKANPQFVHRTQREWAKDIGCAVGQVSNLPFWIEVAIRTGRKRKGKRPRVVSLTDKVLAATADPEAEMNRLIAESNADREPSPLELDPNDRPARVKAPKNR